uniref:NADH dehydrogenase subunit 5 n=1 Tax=Curculio bimaculatus TaxID=1150200 RepID=UPI00286B9995|nr:NADH dehydrogenase subunit 5 [Curculio bimaculatus]WKW54875.1 NADH dehydrogenase subunit 5 [Curculio bimaculatus]
MFLMCNFFFVIFFSFSVSLFLLSLYFISTDLEVYVELYILSFNSVSVVLLLFLDWISLIFMSFVFFISSLILKYSEEYMNGDKNYKRFILLMILFVFSMMLMILSPNLISILLGWDGLGLVSYALVVYYQNVKSFNAGMLTALSNRVGDAALLMSIALMMDFGSFSTLFYSDFLKNNPSMQMAMLFLFLAAITKSAQIPFSSWLPAAMAAPTPVSSLVHSSTLVTAGVYLLMRFSSGFSNNVMSFLLYISLFTMLMSGLGANFEFDLKKIIALSTLSQLGMMLTIMCLGSKDLAFFHLLMHALFKALLFMCAGAIIHNMSNFQDIRFMGGIVYFMPLTCACFNISSFALCGLPFLSGFYSKDLIAEVLSMEFSSLFIYIIFFISVGLTVSYSIRLTWYTLLSDTLSLSMVFYSDNNNKIMLKGMMGLIILVILAGKILASMLFTTPYFIILPSFMKLFTLLMILLGAMIGFELSVSNYTDNCKSMKMLNYSLFASSMWNMPILSTFGVSPYFLNLGKIYFKLFDSGWMEYYGSKSILIMLKNSSQGLQILSRNHIKLYLFLVLLFSILMITCF